MIDWTSATVGPDTTVVDVMRRIDAIATQITLVVSDDGRLLGTVTDGDIRRGILRGVALDDPATVVMNKTPTTASPGEDTTRLTVLMRNRHLRQIPIVDAGGRLVGLHTIDDIAAAPVLESAAVLMAGGLGTRLLPLTERTPKPMLPLGGRPILEHTLVGLAEQGFRQFYLSINYLGDVIENHFGDGSRWGVSIDYIRETERMGTAGALSLLPERPLRPLLVMNGDIVTKLNFEQLMRGHQKSGAQATACVRTHEYQVPFGVVRIDQDRLLEIEEKPVVRHFVSAGIYVVEPDALDQIPPNRFFDMPQLLNTLAGRGTVNVFPITEYWLDIGRHEELDRAMLDFATPQ